MSQNITSKAINALSQDVREILKDLQAGIEWSDTFLTGESKSNSSRKLKSYRRALNKIDTALQYKPAAAMYGESQVGKSYLIKNLLSEPKAQLRIKNPGTGNYHDFLEEINPKGDKVESTSVVTRFTTKRVAPEAMYPIKIRLLDVKSVLIVIFDTYLSDIARHENIPSVAEISSHLDELSQGIERSEKQHFLTEDGVFEIEEYLQRRYSDKALVSNLLDAEFWSKVASFISRSVPEEWESIFSIAWGKNTAISEVFEKLINGLEELNFANHIFAEFDCILRRYGTILHVVRLRELMSAPLYEDVKREDYKNSVGFRLPGSTGSVVKRVNKSVLCALTAELVMMIDKEMEQKKPFLQSSDLLDFPGARSRKKIEVVEGQIGEMILRGKVSYAFNSYSSSYLINNLIFCNRDEQINTTSIPSLLNSWITEYIGNSPSERELFLKDLEVPPLFVVYTFFNNDLKYNSINDRPTNLDTKWIKRFYTIFSDQIVTNDYDWYKNWTSTQPFFRNNFMLRDFEHSELVFEGYKDSGTETAPRSFSKFPGYLDELKDSFVNFEFVKNHFNDPEEMWSNSATLNNDGSKLILENLTKVSGNRARTEKFVREVDRIHDEVLKELGRHYHDDKADAKIKTADQQSKVIRRNIDTIFGKDPDGYGRFMRSMLLTEDCIYDLFKEILESTEPVDAASLNGYILIRNSNPQLSRDRGAHEHNLNTLKAHYGFSNNEELENFFEKRHIDVDELLYGNSQDLQSASDILAEAVRDYWFENYLHTDSFTHLIEQGFEEQALESLLANLKNNFKARQLTLKLAQGMREYVDRYDRVDEAREMIADISTAIVNKFLISAGADFYPDSVKQQIVAANEQNKLNLQLDFLIPRKEFVDNEELAGLFDSMYRYEEMTGKSNLDREVINKFPNVYHISKWKELVRIAFIANCEIPTYDVLANAGLGEILNKIEKHDIKLDESDYNDDSAGFSES